MTSKEKKFFDKVEKFWGKTPQPLKDFIVWLRWVVVDSLIVLLEKLWEETPQSFKNFTVWLRWVVVVGLIVLFFGTYGFTEKFNININGERQADYVELRADYRCPTDYDTKEDYVDSVLRYTDEALENNPNVTLTELSKKRMDWFISMGCEKHFWDIQDYKTYSDNEIGFTFEYPDYLFVDDDLPFEKGNLLGQTDNPLVQLVIFPDSWKYNTDQPFTAIKIIVEENNDLLTPAEWIETSDFNYEAGVVSGQQAVSIDGSAWVIFNTPDQKRRMHISILLDVKNGAMPLFEEMLGIVDSFFFREKVVWMAKIHHVLTYGRGVFENLTEGAEYKYFVGEPYDYTEEGARKYSPIISSLMNSKDADIVKISGVMFGCFWEDGVTGTDYKGCVPWINLEKIEKQ